MMRTSGTEIVSPTVPTTMDKPIYLPYWTILRQLQGDVHKCINNWAQQRVIHPSNCLYASQVVMVHKKTWEVHLCVDYRNLNSITIRDVFSLSHIDEALQAVHKVTSLLPLAWLRGIYNWPWQKKILRKLHLG